MEKLFYMHTIVNLQEFFWFYLVEKKKRKEGKKEGGKGKEILHVKTGI